MLFLLIAAAFPSSLFAQRDTLPKRDSLVADLRRDTLGAQVKPDTVPLVRDIDTVLRITNLNPYITLHVDSTLNYKLDINKDPSNYYWFLRNAPVGLKINKDNGLLTFKADKSFFLSGRLKYDNNYKVSLGVQNLKNPQEKVDTFFTLLFYSTEILASRVKPTVNDLLFIDEGDTLDFKVQCEAGSFPIETISMLSSIPLKNYKPVNRCDDDFMWVAPYDFIKEGDTTRQRLLTLKFIGVNKFQNKDTATVRIYVRNALNYPLRLEEYNKTVKDVKLYILQLKYAFKELDKKVRKTKNTRTTFDLASGSTALGGTIFSTTQEKKTLGTILPSVGVALVPVKEAVSPAKTYEQNSASLVRTSIRRLEYSLTDNVLLGDRDPEILLKSKKLKDDVKQIQVQLIDVPTLDTNNLSEEELNNYFNSPKVNKKYKVTRN
ncbi:MAG: hypothetical protein INR73_14565 [Williamsia sp.]|nr:hypothetical protein [Williamsia sp.]